MTTERENFVEICLAWAEAKAVQWKESGSDTWHDGLDGFSLAYIRDNITRFRIKPEVVDVAGELEALIVQLRTAANYDTPASAPLRAVATRLTALAESIRGNGNG